MAAAANTSQLSGTASLLHNNLTCSLGGRLASVHNAVNVGNGKILLYNLASASSSNGPEVAQVTSIRYAHLAYGSVLCVCSTNGTQVYSEDASTMVFYAPLTDVLAAGESELKYHQGVCVVPGLQHIVVGTSQGSLLVIQALAADKFAMVAPPASPGASTGVADLCYSAVADAVITAHHSGELRVWATAPGGPYMNTAVIPATAQAPVFIGALGSRLVVGYGPGTVCLYDAVTRELQAELTAHARWLTGMCLREERSQVATVGEDTVLNVWQVDPDSGSIAVHHSCFVADKLLTGVAFHAGGLAVTAYDAEELYQITVH